MKKICVYQFKAGLRWPEKYSIKIMIKLLEKLIINDNNN